MAFVLAALWWSLAWWRDLEFGYAMAGNLLLYGTICVIAKLVVDPVLLWAGAAYFLGCVGIMALPSHGWEVLAMATVVAMWAPAWRWRGVFDGAAADRDRVR